MSDVLHAGELVEGEITDDDAIVHTETLDETYDDAPVMGRDFVLEVEESGPYTLELRSYFFDAYLVLRDAEGNVLAEDDDGLIGTHARLVADLSARETYRIDACALHGARGRFELSLRSGATFTKELAAHERAAAEREDAERRVRTVEQVLGPEHPTIAASLGNLALLLKSRGDYAGARPLYERALAIREKALGPEHPDVAASLNSLAVLLRSQGDYAGARPLLERALAIREKVLGPEHPDTARSLNNLAEVLVDQGDLAGARPLQERALAILEEVLGPEHPDTAVGLNNLALLLGAQGDLAGARPLHERALAIKEKVLGPDHPETATSLSNLAVLLCLEGDYAAARPLFERALAIEEKVLGPEHPAVALSLNNLASVLWSTGDYAGARPLLERALAIGEQALGSEHPDVALSLNILAGLLESQGDYAGARPLQERALAIREKVLGPEHPDVALSLNNLAALLESQGDYAGARPLYERALAIREKVLGPEHPDVASNLNNLAALLYSQGDYAGARPIFERSLANLEKVLGPEHPDVARGLNNLAELLRSQGDYAGPRPLFERSLAILENVLGPDHPDVAHSLSNLAQLLFDSGETEGAWRLLSRAARGRRGHVQGVLQGLSEAESYRYLSKLHWQLELQLSVGSTLGDAETLGETYEGLLAWKGRIARALVASREQLARDLDEGQCVLLEELRRAQARLSSLLTEEPPAGQEERSVHADRLAELRRGRNVLELELNRSLASDSDPIPSVEQLASALPARTAVLDLFVHSVYAPTGSELEDGRRVRAGGWIDDHVCAWIVRAGDPGVTRVDLGVAAPIQRAVRRHLGSLTSEGVARGTRVSAEASSESDAGETLRRVLWDPLAEHLEGVEAVFVSPDSFLGTLPLETLPLEDGSFLIEHMAFVYQQDIASLARAGATPTTSMTSLLSVGAVDFGERADSRLVASAQVGARSNDALRGSFGVDWAFLPATEPESRSVLSMHEDAFGDESDRLLLQGADPTEERLKHELSRHSVLHLATHGFFHPEGTPSMWESALNERGSQEMRMSSEVKHLVGKHPGLLSGLVCAGANRPPEGKDDDDGYLTAEEVGWLNLSNVELVVMSACETGLGRAESGEGLIGLRRAFRTAGAKTVVSSLWSVGDESTAELMQDFYANLWTKGMGRLEALRAAQLAMLEKNRREHGAALPSTWGAFVLSGEWR